MKKPLTYRATTRKTLLAFEGRKCAQLSDLARKVKRSKSAICRALKKLEQGGHVQRLRLDRRSSSLVFTRTKEGQRLVCAWQNVPFTRQPQPMPVTPTDIMRN